ncbi:MAG TPA: cardiolipin synthase [Firmicutes bacterium]|jgi:cardiolipin synthase|nr:cardiolipin synthase [Bacillota bacterium]
MRQILWLLYIGYLFFVIFTIFFSRKKPTQRFSWILVLVFLPVVGLIVYSVMGSDVFWDYKRRKIRERHRAIFLELDAITRRWHNRSGAELSPIQQFNFKWCGSIFTDDNAVEVYTNGGPKFARLFADLRAAQDHIHVQYFTIHNDAVGRELFEILKEKARQGVEVKLLYDSFGCGFTFVRPLFRELKAAGGLVHGIRPWARALNYRNHRKLVIVDGRVGYLGGMNVGEHYAEGVKGMVWRDTHVRLTGGVVRDLQQIFISDWVASMKKGRLGFRQRLQHYFPEVEANGHLPAQIVANGLYNKYIGQDVINLSYFNLINSAKDRLWIQTPYFAPSEAVLQSLKTLALRGVDVRIMTSSYYTFGGLFHHNIKNYFFRQLIDSGVRVFKYKGIMHAKAMLIDDDKLCIGTVNLNVRSLERDDEVFIYFESQEESKVYSRIFETDLEQSIELDYARFKKETLLSRALESVVSLFSPLS